MSAFDQEESAASAVLNEWFRDKGHAVPSLSAGSWDVTPYRDAFLFSSGQGRRSNMLYLVRGKSVAPFSPAVASLEETYLALE